MKIYRYFHDTYFGNPLLRYRILNASPYRWINLVLFLLLLTAIGSSVFLFAARLEAQRYVAALPPELRGNERNSLFKTYALPGVYEAMADDFHSKALIGIWFIAAVHIVSSALNRAFRRKPMITGDIQMLPLTPAQIITGLYDWPFIKYFTVFWMGYWARWIPARIEYSYNASLREWLYPFFFYSSSHISLRAAILINLLLFCMSFWVFLFYIHRVSILWRYRRSFLSRCIYFGPGLIWIGWNAFLYLNHQNIELDRSFRGSMYLFTNGLLLWPSLRIPEGVTFQDAK